MRVRYYVRSSGDQFQVLREGKPQGHHPSKLRAIDAAVFMASIEAAKQQTTAELFVENDAGQLIQERVVSPTEQVGISLRGSPGILRVGVDGVLIAA